MLGADKFNNEAPLRMRRPVTATLLMSAGMLIIAMTSVFAEPPKPPLRLLQVDPDRGARAGAGIPDATRWPTEAISREIQKTLDALGALIAGERVIGPKDVAGLADAKISCDPLRPARLETIFDEGSIVVRRPPIPAAAVAPIEGTAGLASALEALRLSFKGREEIRVSFQIVGIDDG